MAATGCHGFVFGSVVLWLVGAAGATHAQIYGEAEATRESRIDARPDQLPHLRTTDQYVRMLVKAGAAHSPTLRKLLAQLDASDVVAYIRVDTRLPGQMSGRTWFVSTAAGIRYVEIALKPTGQLLSTVAMLAHELGHAIEVASDPAIVDAESMAERFLSTGIVRAGGSRRLVDTEFARGVGTNVQRELTPFIADLAAAVH